MDKETVMNGRIHISYSQFMVYEASEESPGCKWEDVHVQQGFARREGVVGFSTMLEYGDAELLVSVGTPPTHFRHERVVAVPFVVTTGRVNIEGPDEDTDERQLALPIGNYRLWCAQHAIREGLEEIQLVFEPVERPVERSAIIVADEQLSPPDELMETSEIADV